MRRPIARRIDDRQSNALGLLVAALVEPPQPLFESSVQGPNLLVTTIQEHARQTGARSLIGSRAVKDYFLLRRQAVYVLNKLRRRDSQGSGHRHVGTQKGVFGAQIHDQNFIP